jgi:hypothetical protein
MTLREGQACTSHQPNPYEHYFRGGNDSPEHLYWAQWEELGTRNAAVELEEPKNMHARIARDCSQENTRKR